MRGNMNKFIILLLLLVFITTCLADLNGIWEDLDQDSIYDLHDGEMYLEIAVSLIKADNLSMAGNEIQILHNWFDRNNLYRNGILQDSDLALGYIDDDWIDWANEYADALSTAYSELEMVTDINSTTADDFGENRWTGNYEWIQVHVHSGPDAHYFYQNNGANYYLVYNNQIQPYNPTALFYNLFCCSNARFTQDNSMGSLYILGNDHGLATIVSTKTGSIEAYDASMVLRYCLGLEPGSATPQPWGAARKYIGDTSGNIEIEAFDASLILRYHVGIINQFPDPLQ